MKTETIGRYNGIPIRREGIPGVVLLSTNGIAAYAFGAKATKNPVWKYSFRSEQERQKYIDDWFAKVSQHEEEKKKRKTENDGAISRLKIGDILSCSWGYEQTNVDFYQVKEIKNKSIVIQEIGQYMTNGEEGFMTGHVMPIPDSFKGKPMLKRVSSYEGSGGVWVRITSFSSATLWDGKPERISWYA